MSLYIYICVVQLSQNSYVVLLQPVFTAYLVFTVFSTIACMFVLFTPPA